MKLYIATSYNRAAEHNRLRDLLAEHGHTLTYDWTPHGPFVDSADVIATGSAELRGVLDAEVLVVLLPGGPGTHLELGVGLGVYMPIILHHETGEPFDFAPTACPFYVLPGIERVTGGYEAVVDAVERLARPVQRIAGAPIVPVSESDDAVAYRAEQGRRRT